MSLKLTGSSAGSVSVDAPASTTGSANFTLTLPVAVGTAGQVLRNSSTPGTLEFGSEAGYVKLQAASSNSAVSDITHDNIDFSVYKALHLICNVIPTTDDTPFNFYWRSGGSDCVADDYFTGYHRAIPSDTEQTEAESSQGRLQLCGNTGNADTQGFYFNMFMFPHASGDVNNMGNVITWQGMHRDGSGNYRAIVGTGRYMSSVSPGGFKIKAHSGNIDHYNYTLYGIRR
tara:strand:+ start:142 stop:831 length:690 start_codon:yes stop_codon:yes gene_type:complete